MPKETVYDVAGCFDIRVGWAREGWVQLSTEMRAPATSTSPQNLRELVATWGPDDGGYGLHSTLDRAGINDLIRHLRRARDQAFGRDE